jgi:glycosyltransferase involved in cell wall biosynthesis
VPDATGPLRALFVNEGQLGTGVLGPVALGGALRAGLPEVPDVAPRFVALSAMGRWAARATRQVPLLAELDADLVDGRWHAVQALRARRLVAAELVREPADVLHVTSHSIALGLVGPMRRVPAVLSVDVGIAEWRRIGVWRAPRAASRAAIAPSVAAERRALRAAAVVQAWSQWSARTLGAPAGVRVEVCHPGLDLERFRPAERTARQRPRVLFVGGRFLPKGGGDLLEALGPMLGRDVELDVVTPADVAERDGVRVHRLGAEDAALVDLHQQADVLCLPTRGDAIPWVVLEAMACGTPVVATDIAAIPEQLGGAGVLVPPRDPVALRRALLDLLADDARRRELGQAGRARAVEHYDARVQVPRLAGLLRWAAGRA